MPHFCTTVGYIDDTQFSNRNDVMREYRRRYSLAAYHQRRAKVVFDATNGTGVCSLCSVTPTPYRRYVGTRALTLLWRDEAAAERAAKLGLKRVNQIATIRKELRDRLLSEGLVAALCVKHARERLYGGAEGFGHLKHGAYYAAFKKKCRCDDCLEYKADNALRRREDRRRAKAEYAANEPKRLAYFEAHLSEFLAD